MTATDMQPMTTAEERSPTLGALFGALAQAQAKVEGAQKGKVNPAFRSKYADLASIWDACREPLAANKLCIVQQPLFEGAKVGLRTTLGHASGEWLAATVWTTPKDNGPQALGSCLTYLRRYALAAVVGVCPDDDDGESAQGRGAEGKGDGSRGASNNPVGMGSLDRASENGANRNATQTGHQEARLDTSGSRDGGERPALPSADKVKHCGTPISEAQLKKLHIMRREAGGSYCTDEGDERSLWRMKVLGVYRDQQGNRLTSSKQLCKEQASHLIERLTRYMETTRATAEKLPDLGAMMPANDTVLAAIKQQGLSQEDVNELVLAPFGADSVDDLEPEDKPKALALVLAVTQGKEPYMRVLEKLGFSAEHLQ